MRTIVMSDQQLERHGLTLDEAASYVGVSPTTLRRVIERGELPAARVGGHQKGRLIILRDNLDEYLARQQQEFEQSRTGNAAESGKDDNSTDT
jgi:excisionase family DNA binding protein